MIGKSFLKYIINKKLKKNIENIKQKKIKKIKNKNKIIKKKKSYKSHMSLVHNFQLSFTSDKRQVAASVAKDLFSCKMQLDNKIKKSPKTKNKEKIKNKNKNKK